MAVDGVSLTIAAAGDGWFEVALDSRDARLARRWAIALRGSRVNLEVDPLARYALHALENRR